MSKYYELTPEATMRRKKRNKSLVYVSLIVMTMVLSAVMTVLANQM